MSTPKKSDTYQIDGKTVPKGEFKRLESTLKGQERWTCAETKTGGIATGGATKSVTRPTATRASTRSGCWCSDPQLRPRGAR